MQIQAPIRPNDFVHSNIEAPLRWVEELAAVDRIPLANITPCPWNGFIARLNNSVRFKKWRFDQTDVRRLFLLEAIEIGPFATTVLIGRGLKESPDTARYAAICPWTMIAPAAETLRSVYIGPDFLAREPNGDNLPALYTGEILRALKFDEIPLNGSDLSGYCRLKWGTLLRIGPSDVERVLDYLTLPKPADPQEPMKVDLGVNMFAIAAFSPSETEPLRVGICWRWNDDLALKEARRWLRSFTPRADKKTFSPTS